MSDAGNMGDTDPIWMPQPPYGPRERVVPFSLAVTDAAFDVFLGRELPDLAHRWKPITSGSVLHSLTAKQSRYAGEFRMRAVSDRETHIELGAAPSTPIQWTVYLAWVLARFAQWLYAEDRPHVDQVLSSEIIQASATVAPVPPALPKNRRGGAPPAKWNERARARLTAGEDREIVYRDWLADRGEDATSIEVQLQGRDAFRKAMGRKGRTDAT